MAAYSPSEWRELLFSTVFENRAEDPVIKIFRGSMMFARGLIEASLATGSREALVSTRGFAHKLTFFDSAGTGR